MSNLFKNSKIIFKLGSYLDSSVGGYVVLQIEDDWYEVYHYPVGWEVPPSDYVYASSDSKDACIFVQEAVKNN